MIKASLSYLMALTLVSDCWGQKKTSNTSDLIYGSATEQDVANAIVWTKSQNASFIGIDHVGAGTVIANPWIITTHLVDTVYDFFLPEIILVPDTTLQVILAYVSNVEGKSRLLPSREYGTFRVIFGREGKVDQYFLNSGKEAYEFFLELYRASSVHEPNSSLTDRFYDIAIFLRRHKN